MLVLTRKTGQKLIIADNIEVTVLETRGDSVKLGVNAPRDITIYREEIFEEIKKENQQATEKVEKSSVDQASQFIKQVKKD